MSKFFIDFVSSIEQKWLNNTEITLVKGGLQKQTFEKAKNNLVCDLKDLLCGVSNTDICNPKNNPNLMAICHFHTII